MPTPDLLAVGFLALRRVDVSGVGEVERPEDRSWAGQGSFSLQLAHGYRGDRPLRPLPAAAA